MEGSWAAVEPALSTGVLAPKKTLVEPREGKEYNVGPGYASDIPHEQLWVFKHTNPVPHVWKGRVE
jgi:hypothetical protein